MRGHFNHTAQPSNSIWLWLFPITYALHIVEEVLGGGGYSAYLERLRGIHLSPIRFMIAQVVGFVLMVLGIFVSRRFKFPNSYCVVLGSVVLVNSLTHTVQTFVHREYVPGLVTAVLIWMPLGIATLLRLIGSVKKFRYWMCILAGVAINLAVELLIISGGSQ